MMQNPFLYYVIFISLLLTIGWVKTLNIKDKLHRDFYRCALLSVAFAPGFLGIVERVELVPAIMAGWYLLTLLDTLKGFSSILIFFGLLLISSILPIIVTFLILAALNLIRIKAFQQYSRRMIK